VFAFHFATIVDESLLTIWCKIRRQTSSRIGTVLLGLSVNSSWWSFISSIQDWTECPSWTLSLHSHRSSYWIACWFHRFFRRYSIINLCSNSIVDIWQLSHAWFTNQKWCYSTMAPGK
jgi:hypothetical protein